MKDSTWLPLLFSVHHHWTIKGFLTIILYTCICIWTSHKCTLIYAGVGFTFPLKVGERFDWGIKENVKKKKKKFNGVTYIEFKNLLLP